MSEQLASSSDNFDNSVSDILEQSVNNISNDKISMMQSDADESLDQLLPQNSEHKIFYSQSSIKSLASEDNLSVYSDFQKTPQQNSNGVVDLVKGIQKGFKDYLAYNQSKSSIQIFGEAGFFGLLYSTVRWLKDKNQDKINAVKKQIELIKTRVSEIQKFSQKEMSLSLQDDFVLAYGHVSPIDTKDRYYRLYELSVTNEQKTQKYIFPLKRGELIPQTAFPTLEFRESDIPRPPKCTTIKDSSAQNKLMSNIYKISELGVVLEVSLESCSFLKGGDGVFIFGQKLANKSLLPFTIFKSVDFSKLDSYLKNLNLEKINNVYTFVGLSFLAIASYQLYTFLRRQMLIVERNKNDVTIAYQFKNNDISTKNSSNQ